MPSVDPSTGKRKSGCAQRQQAGANKARRAELAKLDPALAAQLPEFAAVLGDVPLEGVPLDVQQPPVSLGVDALIAWAAEVQALAAAAQSARMDPARAWSVTIAVKALGSLRKAAAECWDTLQIRAVHDAVPFAVPDTPEPPRRDPVALPAWAFCQLAWLVHAAATRPLVDEGYQGEVKLRATALKTLAQVLPEAEIDALIDRLREED